MLTIDEAAALFARRREAWLREDLDAYLDCWTDDTIFESPVHRAPIRGREAYAALVRASASAVRPMRFDVLHLAVAADVVLAEWEIEAEHRASGRRLCWQRHERRRLPRRADRVVAGVLEPGRSGARRMSVTPSASALPMMQPASRTGAVRPPAPYRLTRARLVI